MTFKPLPFLTILTIGALGVLFMLGKWQWDKYEEKHLDADALQKVCVEDCSVETLAQFSGMVAGTKPQFVYSVYNGRPVWRTIWQVEEANIDLQVNGPVFVANTIQIGVEPDKADVFRPDLAPANYIAITPASRNWLTPADKPAEQIWYTADPVAMAEQLGLTNADGAVLLEPEMINAVDLEVPGQASLRIRNPYANPALIDDLPPQRHLGYAITWWGLALGLIGVYVAFHVSRGRLKFS